MKITLSPVACFNSDTPPVVGEGSIFYRGVEYDLTPLGEGCEVPAQSPFIGTISNDGGLISLTLEYRYDVSLAEDLQPTNIEDYTFIVEAGQEFPDPIIYKPQEVLEDVN